jgi:hypothetical protein
MGRKRGGRRAGLPEREAFVKGEPGAVADERE